MGYIYNKIIITKENIMKKQKLQSGINEPYIVPRLNINMRLNKINTMNKITTTITPSLKYYQSIIKKRSTTYSSIPSLICEQYGLKPKAPKLAYLATTEEGIPLLIISLDDVALFGDESEIIKSQELE